jgi:hypothetical protein
MTIIVTINMIIIAMITHVIIMIITYARPPPSCWVREYWAASSPGSEQGGVWKVQAGDSSLMVLRPRGEGSTTIPGKEDYTALHCTSLHCGVSCGARPPGMLISKQIQIKDTNTGYKYKYRPALTAPRSPTTAWRPS